MQRWVPCVSLCGKYLQMASLCDMPGMPQCPGVSFVMTTLLPRPLPTSKMPRPLGDGSPLLFAFCHPQAFLQPFSRQVAICWAAFVDTNTNPSCWGLGATHPLTPTCGPSGTTSRSLTSPSKQHDVACSISAL